MSETLNLQNDQPDDLKKGLLVSLGAHVAIFLFFTVKMVFFTGEPINYQAAVRVDLVALPDKIDPKQTPPPIAPKTPEKPEAKAPSKEAVKVEPAKPTEPKLADTKEVQQKALSKLKAMEALERLKQEAQKESSKTAASSNKKQEGEIKFKGNILSPGTELTGLNRLQHEEYIANLDRHIKQNWTLPEWLAKKDYKAQIRVRIDEKGRVISKQLVKSSGNPSYDDIVSETIDRSAPFPPPPEKFMAILSVSGILIGFPE